MTSTAVCSSASHKPGAQSLMCFWHAEAVSADGTLRHRTAAHRPCLECGARDTPQWREGPHGPNTLCNKYASALECEGNAHGELFNDVDHSLLALVVAIAYAVVTDASLTGEAQGGHPVCILLVHNWRRTRPAA